MITLPLLVLVADIIGVFGGFIVATYKLGFNPAGLSQQHRRLLHTDDVVSGLVKAAVFGFIIALMGCYHGYNRRGGAQGVGAATTNAVVSASILILLVDYFLTAVAVLVMSDGRQPPKIDLRGAEETLRAQASCSTASISTSASARALVVIGGSGTGKSVLIKCILGLMHARRRLDHDRRRGGDRPAARRARSG